jgi:predicted ester cyclase
LNTSKKTTLIIQIIATHCKKVIGIPVNGNRINFQTKLITIAATNDSTR